jgi:hypothetical protein
MRSTGRIAARVVLVDGATSGRREAWSTRSPADGTGTLGAADSGVSDES